MRCLVKIGLIALLGAWFAVMLYRFYMSDFFYRLAVSTQRLEYFNEAYRLNPLNGGVLFSEEEGK